MKQNIHPPYYPQAKIRCACGNAFTAGATKEALEVEICSGCHPFYTGEQKVIDAAGRVERYRRIVAEAELKAETRTSVTKREKQKQRQRKKGISGNKGKE